ncbi:MAG: AIR synthase related protein [Paracoccaceae bacterium]
MTDLKLTDLGERRILSEIIPNFVSGAGDDCSITPLANGFLVSTMDPVPLPAAQAVGGSDDPYYAGWLLVTINASDIAASGAVPQTFLASFDMVKDWPISSLKRLMQGVRDSCDVQGLEYVGGNIREARKFVAVGVANGYSLRPPLTRHGAEVGSRLFVFGESGKFWSDVLDIKDNRTVDKAVSPLFRPISQVRNISILHEDGLLQCAMDTSDGLAPTLEELADKNKLGLVIDTQAIKDHSLHLTSLERPERLWMGWGDWTVVAAVSPDKTQQLRQTCGERGIQAIEIGEFTDSAVGVFLNSGSSKIRLGRLESERFAQDSWFHLGIDAYEQMLRQFPLPG